MKEERLRMCIACRSMQPRNTLIRVVRQATDGVERTSPKVCIDYNGKTEGRGAYLCSNAQCYKRCLKGKQFNRALKCAVPESVYLEVEEIIKNATSVDKE